MGWVIVALLLALCFCFWLEYRWHGVTQEVCEYAQENGIKQGVFESGWDFAKRVRLQME